MARTHVMVFDGERRVDFIIIGIVYKVQCLNIYWISCFVYEVDSIRLNKCLC